MRTVKNQTLFNVFCYGTLEFDAIMRRVTGSTFSAETATLVDYARYMVKGAPYPAVIEEPGAATTGTLFRGLNKDQLQRMDEYEDSLYDRIENMVLTDKGELVTAYVYVIPESRKHFVGRDLWDKNEFERIYLEAYSKTV